MLSRDERLMSSASWSGFIVRHEWIRECCKQSQRLSIEAFVHFRCTNEPIAESSPPTPGKVEFKKKKTDTVFEGFTVLKQLKQPFHEEPTSILNLQGNCQAIIDPSTTTKSLKYSRQSAIANTKDKDGITAESTVLDDDIDGTNE